MTAVPRLPLLTMERVSGSPSISLAFMVLETAQAWMIVELKAPEQALGQAVLDQAQRDTGLGDFGDDLWREPFGVLLKALEEEATLLERSLEQVKRRIEELRGEKE